VHADVLLSGAHVVTQDRRQPRARSLAIAGGRILAVGAADDELDDLIGSSTRVLRLNNVAVVPGFVDAHVHFGHYAVARRQVDLDAAATLEDGLELVRTAAARLDDRAAWVQGRGWDRNRWGRLPDRADLDAATGNRPAALSSHDGHSLWLNSAALRATGVTASTNDPAGGVIQRDEGGEPTGVLFENAQDLAREHIPEPSDRELRESIREALRAASAAGLTGIHNLEDARTRRAFQALEAAGELTLRVYHGVSRGELPHARERGLRTGIGSDWLRIGPLKLFSDGALGSRTAFMLEPYVGRSDGYRGVPTLSPEELDDALRLAAESELDVAVHAIGDAAVRGVLDAFERAQHSYPLVRQRLLRIEHAQLVDPADQPRFRALGVVASMQPIHATADWRTAEQHWGERSRHGYPWRGLLQTGATLAFGTDAPVERIEPLLSVYAAVARRDLGGEPASGWYPEQCLSLDEAVRAYTLGSAAAERASGRRGTLAAGMDADLVVLEPDPFGQPDEALRETRIALTMVGGRITFDGGL
jgi:predicted amidohydrolase YtcJ